MIEYIGPQPLSFPKRLRKWLADFFGPSTAALLERERAQVRIDLMEQIRELRRDRDRYMEALMAVKQIPLKSAVQVQPSTAKIPMTNWQMIQAEAIAENAKLEEEDAKVAPKEN